MGKRFILLLLVLPVFCYVTRAEGQSVKLTYRKLGSALPPVNLEWTLFIIDKIVDMQSRREHLEAIGHKVRQALNPLNGAIVSSSHIVPFVLGETERAVQTALKLQHEAFICCRFARPPYRKEPPG